MIEAFRKLYGFLLRVYNSITAKTVDVSIADLMYPHKSDSLEMDYTQFTTIARIMDIEAYMKGDDSFKYQAALERMIKGKKFYDYEKDKRRFQRLINSIDKHGYDSSVKCDIDLDGYITDGTHRIAMAWYIGMFIMPCRVIRRRVKRPIDWFYMHSSDSDIFIEAANRARVFHSDMVSKGYSFCCEVDNHFDEAKHYLSSLVTVINSRITTDKKSVILFTIDNPNYQYQNGRLISLTARRISAIMAEYGFKNDCNVKVSLNVEEGHNMWMK